MKKISTLLLIFLVHNAFAVEEGEFLEKLSTQNVTYKLQSENFFGEAKKFNKLVENPNSSDLQIQTLYQTSTISLCITLSSLNKTKILLRDNPKLTATFFTKKDVESLDYNIKKFEGYKKEFRLSDQSCEMWSR